MSDVEEDTDEKIETDETMKWEEEEEEETEYEEPTSPPDEQGNKRRLPPAPLLSQRQIQSTAASMPKVLQAATSRPRRRFPQSRAEQSGANGPAN